MSRQGKDCHIQVLRFSPPPLYFIPLIPYKVEKFPRRHGSEAILKNRLSPETITFPGCGGCRIDNYTVTYLDSNQPGKRTGRGAGLYYNWNSINTIRYSKTCPLFPSSNSHTPIPVSPKNRQNRTQLNTHGTQVTQKFTFLQFCSITFFSKIQIYQKNLFLLFPFSFFCHDTCTYIFCGKETMMGFKQKKKKKSPIRVEEACGSDRITVMSWYTSFRLEGG